jgi:hypothetical protein
VDVQGTWGSGPVYTAAGYNESFINTVPGIPSSGAYAEFASIAAPEPGAGALTLTGLGLLGLIVVMRKRKAPGLQQAS